MKKIFLLTVIISSSLFASSNHCAKVYLNDNFYEGYKYQGQSTKLNDNDFQYFRLGLSGNCGFRKQIILEKRDFSLQNLELYKPAGLSLNKSFCPKSNTQDMYIELRTKTSAEYVEYYGSSSISAKGHLDIKNPKTKTSLSVQYVKCSEVPRGQRIY